MDTADGLTIGDRTYARFREVSSPGQKHTVSLASVLFLLWWFLSSILLVWWARRLSDVGDFRGVQVLGIAFALFSLVLPLCIAPILLRKRRAEGSEIPADLPKPPNSDSTLVKILVKLGSEDGVVDRGWMTVKREELRFQGHRCSFLLTSEEVRKVSRSGAWITLMLTKHSPVPRQSVSVWAYEIRGNRAYLTTEAAQQLQKKIAAISASAKASLLPPIDFPWPTAIDREKVIRLSFYGLIGGIGVGLLTVPLMFMSMTQEHKTSPWLFLPLIAISGALSTGIFAIDKPLKAKTRNKQIAKWQRQATKA